MAEDYSDLINKAPQGAPKRIDYQKDETKTWKQKGDNLPWLDTFYKYHRQIGLLFLVIGFAVGFIGVYTTAVLYGVAMILIVIGGVLFLMDEIMQKK